MSGSGEVHTEGNYDDSFGTFHSEVYGLESDVAAAALRALESGGPPDPQPQRDNHSLAAIESGARDTGQYTVDSFHDVHLPTEQGYPVGHVDLEAEPDEQHGAYCPIDPLSEAASAGKAWACQECGQGFRTKWLAQRHYKNVHLKERAFPCEHPGCERAFFRADHLLAHRATHENRIRVCPKCNKTLRCEKNYVKHMTSHEKMEQAKANKGKPGRVAGKPAKSVEAQYLLIEMLRAVDSVTKPMKQLVVDATGLSFSEVHTWFRDQRRKIRELQGLRQVPENTRKKLLESAARFIATTSDSASASVGVISDPGVTSVSVDATAASEPLEEDGSDSDCPRGVVVTLPAALSRALTACEAKTIVLEELCEKAQRARLKLPSPTSAAASAAVKTKRGARTSESLLCDEGDDDGPLKRARDTVAALLSSVRDASPSYNPDAVLTARKRVRMDAGGGMSVIDAVAAAHQINPTIAHTTGYSFGYPGFHGVAHSSRGFDSLLPAAHSANV